MKKMHKVLLIIVALTVGYLTKNTAEICSFGTKDQKCRADTAIVLGAAAYDGQVSPVYAERINHGITLYNEGYVKKIIVTGGKGNGREESDAAAAKRYAVSKGVPEAAILTEEASAITQENLEKSKKIIDNNAYHTAIIVSDPLHMKRAMLLAKDIGITAYSSPTPTSKYVSLKTQLPFLAREVFFYISYKWYRLFV